MYPDVEQPDYEFVSSIAKENMRPCVWIGNIFVVIESRRFTYSIHPLLLQLVLLNTGGHLIYSGPLGQRSSSVIKYFEVSLL